MANQDKINYKPIFDGNSGSGSMPGDNKIHPVNGKVHPRFIGNNPKAITVPGTKVSVGALKNVDDIRYGVPTVGGTFPVLNMTCASCAARVEKVLRSQEGIVDARVNLASAMVSVEYIPGVIQPEAMRMVVRESGYDLYLEDASVKDESLETIHRQQISRLKRRSWWALALSVPIVVIGMFFMHIPFAREILWVLSTPVVLWLGRDFFINGWKQTKRRTANMDTLVAMSTGVAYLFSVFNTLFPRYWESRGLEVHVYFEAAAVIIAFILLGKLLEERAKGSASMAIKKLMGLQPQHVTVVRQGKHLKVSIDEVIRGNRLLVKPGDKIAVDGVVADGSSYVDESMLSGEPLPVLKKANDHVFAGTINQKGSFTFIAEKVGSDTMLAQIIKTVQDAQGSKAPVQKLVDKIAGIFVPVVMIIAITAFIVWNVVGVENGFTQGLLALITVLVIACPCALGLATPTAIMVGMGKGAQQGILIKDAESLELTKRVSAVVLDKTGTITEGKPVVTNDLWIDENPILKQVLLSIERQSEHPLAEAVAAYLHHQEPVVVSQFESISGKGVTAIVDGHLYVVGNRRLVEEKGVPFDSKIAEKAGQWSREAKSVLWFANSRRVLAILAVADPIKPSSVDAIQELLISGVEVHMLTGDNEATAKSIAGKTGIHHVKAGLLPGEKADYVKALQAGGKIVAMAGDGINDSVALAQADVSIAMGRGSDIAMDVARMTIISSNLMKISEAIRLSKATVATIRQNLFWAFFYNVIGIPIAAGILYPVNGFLLDPMIAGAAMALSSVSVVTNSLRLQFKS